MATVTTAAGSDTTKRMPPRESGMSAATFRRVLKKAGLSQAQAAERLGVSLRTVNRWANGKGTITKPVAFAIRAKLPHD